MISQKFSILSENRIISFMNNKSNKKDINYVINSIESVSDLWVLANINETYNEEVNIHSSIADSTPDMYFPH